MFGRFPQVEPAVQHLRVDGYRMVRSSHSAPPARRAPRVFSPHEHGIIVAVRRDSMSGDRELPVQVQPVELLYEPDGGQGECLPRRGMEAPSVQRGWTRFHPAIHPLPSPRPADLSMHCLWTFISSLVSGWLVDLRSRRSGCSSRARTCSHITALASPLASRSVGAVRWWYDM